MNVPVPVICLTLIGPAWLLTQRKRIIPTREEILNRIHKGELDSLIEFTPHNATRDVLKTDKPFWECMGGFRGLRRKRENAVCCVQLCQRYVIDANMDKQDVEYASQRSFTIAFLRIASIPEQGVRLIMHALFRWSMPHFCARWIAHLYFELATYTQGLNLDYGGELLAL